jgi:predicted RNA-binding Zn-ribbon protein involved in translation (DUF1610 family)
MGGRIMHKCDSCGKVVINEKEYMCPHCGAVAQKHCDHSTHLPDDKYNRANDYRTAAAEHKSKTYNYEKTPRTDSNQKFDINDLANIKNAEDAKRVAKKAFIEQDQNGRKKFKPLAIFLIVISATKLLGAVNVTVDGNADIEFATFTQKSTINGTNAGSEIVVKMLNNDGNTFSYDLEGNNVSLYEYNVEDPENHYLVGISTSLTSSADKVGKPLLSISTKGKLVVYYKDTN